MKPYVITALAATAVALSACRNGPNNARDTTGMPNNSAAGSVYPGSGLGPGASTGTVTPGAATPTPATPVPANPGATTPGATTPGATPYPTDTSRDTTRKRQP